MIFFGKKQRKYLREEHKTKHWNEALYSALFTREESEYQKVNGQCLNCELTRRESSIGPNYSRHTYYGFFEVSLDVYGGYSVFIVKVTFEQPSEWLISHSLTSYEDEDDRTIGFMSFRYDFSLLGEETPSIDIILIDQNGFAEKTSNLFVEAKTTDSRGLEFEWRAILTSIKGGFAKFLENTRDKEGQGFPLESCEFILKIK